MMNVRIEQIRPRRTVAIVHRGDYGRIGEKFAQLGAYAAERGLPMALAGTLAIYYDDPRQIAPEQLRSAACLEVPPDFVPADGDPVEVLTIPGGDYAVAVHRGSYAGLGASYRWLYDEWLPTSGRAAADRPDFEVYLNDCATTPQEQLETAIHIPLEAQ